MTAKQMIPIIRSCFGSVETIDPSGPIYARLCALLDRADDNALRAVYKAKIKFVSPLALNRMIARGLV